VAFASLGPCPIGVNNTLRASEHQQGAGTMQENLWQLIGLIARGRSVEAVSALRVRRPASQTMVPGAEVAQCAGSTP